MRMWESMSLGAGSAVLAMSLLTTPVQANIDVVEMTVADIEAGFAANSFTSVDLVNAFLARTNAWDYAYNAFISFNPNALAYAAQMDAERALGNIRSPLHGVPVVIKDNMDYAGLVTTNGYIGFSSKYDGIDIIPSQHASVTKRLIDAGAVIIGKTNLPDFAFDGLRSNSTVLGGVVGNTSIRDSTFNAHNRNRAPGGSSGGTATAVNASFAVLGLGTETGRSIHNPSGFQSLVGVRPTHGGVPIDGIYPLNGSFRDVAGPIAKTVYDAAVTLDAIYGPAARDPLSAGSQVPTGGFTSKLSSTALQGKRIGYFDPQFQVITSQGNLVTPFRAPDTATQTLYDAAVNLAEAQGATIVRDDIFTTANWVDYFLTQPSAPSSFSYDQWSYLQSLGPTTPFSTIEEYRNLITALGKPGAYANLLPGVPQTSDTTDTRTTAAGIAWLNWRDGLLARFDQIMDDLNLDALLWPINGSAPPTLATAAPGGSNNSPLIQGVINILGTPGVIVPAGYYASSDPGLDGTPFGVVFIGRHWSEADLLGLAYDFELASAGTSLERIAPTLVPEPGTLVVLTMSTAMLLVRRRQTV